MSKTMRIILLGPALLSLPWILPGQAGAPPREQNPDGLRLRRPIALTLIEDGQRLLVANRDSGTVAMLDTHKLQLVAETRVGRKLSDLTASRKGDLVLVT